MHAEVFVPFMEPFGLLFGLLMRFYHHHILKKPYMFQPQVAHWGYVEATTNTVSVVAGLALSVLYYIDWLHYAI